MSLINKQLIINEFILPTEILDIVKEYLFYKIKKIPKNDKRYDLLLTIPIKEYYNGNTYVYINISDNKDYYLVYTNFTIQIQTLGYDDDDNVNHVYFIDGYIFVIE